MHKECNYLFPWLIFHMLWFWRGWRFSPVHLFTSIIIHLSKKKTDEVKFCSYLRCIFLQLFLPLKLTSDVPTLLQSLICPVMMQFADPTVADMQLCVGLHSKMGHEIIRFKNKYFVVVFVYNKWKSNMGQSEVMRTRAGQLCLWGGNYLWNYIQISSNSSVVLHNTVDTIITNTAWYSNGKTQAPA